jgi:flagellin-like protein
MNGWKLGARQRGRGRKRAVSPIIATILLVAITVVLAAVLYVLISGLTSGGGSVPYSIGMSETGANTLPASGNWIQIAVSTSSGLTTGLFSLKITDSTNTSTLALSALPANATNCKYLSTGEAYTAGAGPACSAPAAGWYAVLVAANGSISSVLTSAGWSASAAVAPGGMNVYVIAHGVISGAKGWSLNAYGTATSTVSGTVNL